MLKFLLVCGVSLFGVSLVAQNTLVGRVTDAETGDPLVGATVLPGAGTAQGTVTDLDGRYSLALPAGTTQICVSYVGMARSRCEPFAGQTELDLEVNTSVGLGEVVVTALGLQRQNAELGYALQEVDARQIADVTATNFLDNLAGQVAGVNVTTGATGVGSTSLVSIRGEASFSRNTPLYVVDGIPIDNRAILNVTTEASQGFQEVDFGNGAPEVSPFDVANVTVLKGPAAAALYGTRASNGVILINTKSGSRAQGLGISVNSQTTLDRPFRLPEFQNRYGQGRGGKFAYVDGLGGGVNDNITFSYGPELDQGFLTTQYDSPVTLADGTVVRAGDRRLYTTETPTPTPFVSHPDNVSDFYQTGVTTHNNVAISQGFDRGDMRLSFTDLRSDSYLPGVDFGRNNVAARLNFRPNDRIRLSTSLNYANSRSDNRPAGGYGSENLNYTLIAWLGRSTALEPLRDYWQPGFEGVQQFQFNTTFFDNPYFILNENRNSFNRDRVTGYLSAAFDLTDKLEFRVRTGIDRSNEGREFRRAYSTNRFARGAYAENAITFSEQNTDALLTYSDKVGDVNLAVSVGGNRLDQRAEFDQTQAEALTVPGVYRLTNSAIPLVTSGNLSERRINSAYGLVRAGFRESVFLDVTGRNDWSSALATSASADGTSFFYPSVGLSWIVSRDLDLPSVVSYFQLRASGAQVGNDTDPYRTGGTFLPSTPVNGAPTYTDQLQLPASGLRPERATAYEVGFDVRLFEERIGLDVTAYTQLNEDQILALPAPISSGYESRVVNGGSVRAEGIEAVINVRAVRRGDFRYDATINFNTAIARVVSLPDGKATTLAYARVYNTPGQTVFIIAEEGGRIGDMYGTGYLRNEAGQYVVNARGAFIADNTLRKLGNYNPDFQVGFTNRLAYRNFNLSALVDWRQGGEVVSRTQALAGYSGQLAITADRPAGGILVPGVMNFGTAEAPNYRPNTTPISAEDYYISYYNREHEEHNTLDATFVKLREVRLGYDFGTARLPWLQDASVALIGRNLAMWSPIKLFDPEQFAAQGQGFVRGVEDMSYPTPRSVGLSLSANF